MVWVKPLIFAFLLAMVCPPAWATMQIPDKIVVEGAPERALLPYDFLKTPLLEAFESDKDVWKRAQGIFLMGMCSALHRGYVAHWEIKARILYLTKVEKDACRKGVSVPLAALFPGSTGPVPATWFTGTLAIANGNVVPGAYQGFQPVYEDYEIIHVTKGQVAAPGQIGLGPPNELFKYFVGRREAFLRDGSIGSGELPRTVCRAISDAERLEREGKYLASIDRLHELEKYGPLPDFPSRDTHMLLYWLYKKLGDKNKIVFYKTTSSVLHNLWSSKIGDLTNKYFEIHLFTDIYRVRVCD